MRISYTFKFKVYNFTVHIAIILKIVNIILFTHERAFSPIRINIQNVYREYFCPFFLL